MKFFLSGYCNFSSAAKVSDTIDLGLPHKEAHTESLESSESPVEIEYNETTRSDRVHSKLYLCGGSGQQEPSLTGRKEVGHACVDR